MKDFYDDDGEPVRLRHDHAALDAVQDLLDERDELKAKHRTLYNELAQIAEELGSEPSFQKVMKKIGELQQPAAELALVKQDPPRCTGCEFAATCARSILALRST